MKMRALLAILTTSLTLCSFPAWSKTANSTKLQSFKSWKEEQIARAEHELTISTLEYSKIINKTNNLDYIEKALKNLKQLEVNVEIYKDLTPNDYFVLYLAPKSKGKDKAFLDAVKGMSSSQIAQIFSSYYKEINRSQKAIQSKSSGSSYIQNAAFFNNSISKSQTKEN